MKIRVCSVCKIYTLEELCPRCGTKTKEASYKFIRLRGQEQK